MRLSAQLDLPQGRLTELVRALMAMPEALRPAVHSSGERNKRFPIEDPEELIAEADRSGWVPFLTAPGAAYDIYSQGPLPITCYARLTVAPDLAREFLVAAAAADPSFGRVATDGDVNRQHFLKLETGSGTVEGLFGRDSTRYVPGLYWWTLIAEDLANRHGVDVEQLGSLAKEHERLPGNRHLLRFYDSPDEWRNAAELDKMRDSVPGIFNINNMKAILPAFHDDRLLADELANWR